MITTSVPTSVTQPAEPTPAPTPMPDPLTYLNLGSQVIGAVLAVLTQVLVNGDDQGTITQLQQAFVAFTNATPQRQS